MVKYIFDRVVQRQAMQQRI